MKQVLRPSFSFSVAAALLCVSSVFTPSICAQIAAAGAILGTVTDPSGAVIPDTDVTISNAATQQSRTTHSNPQGFYDFESLLAATYQITIKKAGFDTFVAHN